VRLSHNMFSLGIYNTYKKTIAENAKSSNYISTGSKLDKSKDNPNKIGKNETLKIEVLTNDAASKNVQDTASMLQTFDGSLQDYNDVLSRMRELAISAGSGDLTTGDKTVIQNEMNSLSANISDLAKNTKFNGISLSETGTTTPLNENPTKSIKNTIGIMEDENMNIPIYDLSAANLGVDSLDVNDVDSCIASIDKATKMVCKVISTYGSLENRLDSTANYLSSRDISIQAAQSKIGDADIAEEMMEYSKSQVLIQSSIALMSQSNNFPKEALNILSNVK